MSSDKVQDYSTSKILMGWQHISLGFCLLLHGDCSCDSPHIASGARSIRQCLQTVRTQLTSIPTAKHTALSACSPPHPTAKKDLVQIPRASLFDGAATYKQLCQQYLEVLHAHLWGDKNQLRGWKPILSRSGAESTLEMCTSDISKNWAFCRDTVNYFVPWRSWDGMEVALYFSSWGVQTKPPPTTG